jgi:epsilon-lactone hydrolase
LEHLTVAGMTAARITPPGGDTERAVLYLHGGGYCRGSIRSHAGIAGRLAVATGGPVVLTEYRLAPEHPFPAAVDDALTAYRFLVDTDGVEPGRIALAGDSAGGGLSLATLVNCRDRGLPLPSGAALLSPWLDLRIEQAAARPQSARDPLLTLTDFRVSSGWYLGDAPATDPLASPVLADLTGLPPLLVQVGSEELLLDDALTLEASAQAVGAPVEVDVAQDMVHCWQLFGGVPEADAAVEAVAAFIGRHRMAAGS